MPEVMRRAGAAAGSALFLVLAPGTVTVLLTWWLTGWRVLEPAPWWAPLRVAGVLLIVPAALVLL
ncbi:MAG: isoprenylcysteine carboxyl methyltransferase, partial [Candidatus Dormibacteraeota bacterium]|nr:isoprenylcysteine carboxyl methyltransferase [Candidatus Dormibacteraeota bacterium]